jgi:hypothetical protein
MIPTLAITSVMKKWLNALANDPDIKAYCLDKFGKEPTFFLEIDKRNPPKKEHCPFIVIWPGKKTEGLSNSSYPYSASIGWVILEEEKETTGNTIEYKGVYEADDLGQLILKAVSEVNPSCPITNVDYSVELTEYQPQYGGRMDITISIPVTIGGVLNY